MRLKSRSRGWKTILSARLTSNIGKKYKVVEGSSSLLDPILNLSVSPKK